MDQRQQDESMERHVQFVEAGEDAPVALQSSEQSLHLVAPLDTTPDHTTTAAACRWGAERRA